MYYDEDGPGDEPELYEECEDEATAEWFDSPECQARPEDDLAVMLWQTAVQMNAAAALIYREDQ
jgi:hypothetical protein